MELSPASHDYCPECGPATIPHGVERFKVRVEMILNYLTKPPEAIWRAIKPAISALRPGRMAPFCARAAAALGLARIMDAPDDKVNLRTRVVWEEATRRGIVMKEFRPFGLPRELFWAVYGNDTRAFDGMPRPRSAHETSINWMDNKGTILEKFRSAGVPVPRGKACTSPEQAEAVFHEIVGMGMGADMTAAVIVKPNIGSRSRHTYVNIKTVEALREAFVKAKQLSPWVVIEEEIPGFVFRITLVGGKPAGVMRREPPHVMGDGKHTVQQLMDAENKNPLRQGPIFHMLELDPAMLATQKLSLDAVPEKHRMVILHPKVSRSFGASTTEITDVHPDNLKLFSKMAEVLDDPLVGIDFIASDLGRSWREQPCGIIECNSLPFIDLHHYPLQGPAKNVAGSVWDLVFPKSRK